MRSLLGLLSFLALGCVVLPQVPASEPHASLLVRVVHPVSNRMYQDFVRLDFEDELELVGLRKELRVRVRPGRHYVLLTTRLASFALQERTVERPFGPCLGPSCAQLIPTREQQIGLVNAGGTPVCNEQLHVQVERGDERLLLLVAGPGCRHCVTADLNTRSCDGVRSLEEPVHTCQDFPPKLTRYDGIEDARAFSVTLQQDERGDWVPTPALAMPYHHASRIEWLSMGPLAPFRGKRVTVRGVGVGAPTVVMREGGDVARASYRARIEQVCPVSPEP